LSQRFRLDTPDWIKNIFIHIPAATILSLIHLAFYVYATFLLGAQKWLDVPNSKMTATQEYFYLVSSPIHVNFRTRFALYAGIVLMVHVVEIYRRSEKEELKELQLEKKLARAKLQALKMQLHPHFLFNTLHSISALIYKDIHGAEEMIDRLMKFLALTLENNGPQTVTLQKELEFLQCYLDIETVRFQDRLTVVMDIDPPALHSKVPNLITQPIVENAIRHGIATRTSAGRIVIRARIEDGKLRLQVLDNGPGITGSKEGLGLKNTRARLHQLYGERHRLEFSNDSSGGLAVIMEIPSDIEPLLDSSPQHISA
jgi:LytS/YehU family sensor histidine kinase